jgi:hypothetical protein
MDAEKKFYLFFPHFSALFRTFARAGRKKRLKAKG